MALKRRFQKRQGQILTATSVGGASGVAISGDLPKTLRVVVDNQPYKPRKTSTLGAFKPKKTIVVSAPQLDDQNEAQRRLSAYRRINELYQDKGVDLQRLLKGFLEIIVKSVQAEGGSLWLIDRTKAIIQCKGATGAGSKELIGFTLPLGKGIVGWVIEKNSSTIVYDTATDDRFSGKSDQKTTFATKSLIACPLCYAGEVIGAVEVVNKKALVEKFTDADKVFLDDICTPAAMHIQSTISRKSNEELLKKMHTFSELHSLFGQTLEIDKLLGTVLNKAIVLLGAEVGSIWLLDDTGERIVCHVAEGPTKSKVIGIKVNKGTGIIGDAVETKQPTIVEDCSKDSRFSADLDKKIGFETRSMITTPLCVNGECIGAIQIINKKADPKGDQALFTKDDMELQMLFASSAAMYIKNAKLFAAQKKAKELSALIGISKEITSTLDLDSVLISIVNLSSDIIPYDRAVVSLQMRGGDDYEVRAITGVEKVDATSDGVATLNLLHKAILQHGKEISFPKDVLPEVLKYTQDMKLQSFWARILSDDQGPLGIVSMESAAKNMIPETKKELLSLLVNQSTVALRNAQLYSTIPNSNILGAHKERAREWFNKIRAWPVKKQMKVAAAIVGTILALIFIKVPYNVATNIEVVPITMTYYSHSKARVSEILVTEGREIKSGDTLIKLDPSDLIIEKKQKESMREKTTSEMIKLQNDDKIAEAKIKEKEKFSLDGEIELLEKQIKNTDIVATHDGIVVSDKLDELRGKPVTFGHELIRVARMDHVTVQFQVPEGEGPFLERGQSVKFKVFGLPNTTFSSGLTLKTVAAEAKGLTEKDQAKFFIATAEVPADAQARSLLRPGMTGRGKIHAKWQPIGFLLFNKPLKFLMMDILF